MLNRITEHPPGTTHPRPAKTATFHTLADLTAIPFVARVAAMRGFHRFAYSTTTGRPRLIAEFERGHDWVAVGNLDGPVEGLPPHQPIRRMADGSLYKG